MVDVDPCVLDHQLQELGESVLHAEDARYGTWGLLEWFGQVLEAQR
jgi:hypothetical protein